MRAVSLPTVDLTTWRPHPLQGPEAIWPERNCYVDPWIGLVHLLGLDPHAMLSTSLTVDFEGDQWTFYKPSHEDLRRHYGLDTQELTIWRPVLDHVLEHVGVGKVVCLETDAFWLPDASGTDYRSRHTKTTIFVIGIDADARSANYLHNAGLHTLSGDDFDQVFAPPSDGVRLPLFAEFVRTDRVRRCEGSTLREEGRALLVRAIAQRPSQNPIRAFSLRYAEDVSWIREGGLERYHAWAFATTRQMGASSELASRWLAWLELGEDAEPAVRAFDEVARGAKALVLKGARAAASPRPVDVAPWFDGLAMAWDTAWSTLERRSW